MALHPNVNESLQETYRHSIRKRGIRTRFPDSSKRENEKADDTIYSACIGAELASCSPTKFVCFSSSQGIYKSGMTNSQVCILLASSGSVFASRPSYLKVLCSTPTLFPTTRGIGVSKSSSYSSAHHPPKMLVIQCSPNKLHFAYVDFFAFG